MRMKVLFTSLVLLLFSCSGDKKGGHGPPPSPVKVAKATYKSVPYYISTVGHIEAYETVNIKAQVDGVLKHTYFKNGADIKKGDLLYLIDQTPYFADLKKAEGGLEKALANQEYAKRRAERNALLLPESYISQNDYDNLVSTAVAEEGSLKQSIADVENAKINLAYTTIYAPMDGRAGFSLVDDGNLILESAKETLVTLNQISPIYATFFINGKDLPLVQRYSQKKGPLKALITLDDPNSPEYTGELTFLNNEIDIATGMIQMKVTLPNTDKELWPNQYIKVMLVLDTLPHAVVIPAEAVQNGPTSKYVFILKRNNTVEKRTVVLGQTQPGHLVVIESGLNGDEVVVTEGQINLYEGAHVIIKEDSP